MITVTPGLLAALNTSYRAAFSRGLGRAATTWEQIAMRTSSSTASEVYPFLGTLGSLREWVGNRVAEELAAYDFEIKNKHFEKTLRVNRDRIEDDQFGLYALESERLGDAAARHPDKLVYTLLEAGFATLCYDGQYFFDTDHPDYNGGTWSNKGTTALAADGVAYGVARQGMMGLKDDGGETLDIIPDLLVVGPALETIARTLLNNEFVSVAGGSTQNNIWKGSARLLVVPRLADVNDWYLFDTTKVVKAFIMQFRKDVQMVAKTSLTDDNVFERNEFIWGVDYRGNAGYGLPQLAFGAHVA